MNSGSENPATGLQEKPPFSGAWLRYGFAFPLCIAVASLASFGFLGPARIAAGAATAATLLAVLLPVVSYRRRGRLFTGIGAGVAMLGVIAACDMLVARWFPGLPWLLAATVIPFAVCLCYEELAMRRRKA